MKTMKKKILIASIALLLPLFVLTGCSKVSLTGTNTNTPPAGSQGDEGGIPPENAGTPPDGGTLPTRNEGGQMPANGQ